MKLVLILCLFYLANVSANTELLRITEKKSGKRDAFDQRFNYPLDGTTSSEYINVLSSGKHIYFNKIIFNSNKITFPLIIYDPIPTQIQVSLNRSTFSSDTKLLSNNSSLNHSLRLNIISSAGLNFSANPGSSDYYYAGTKLYTISGDPPNTSTRINPMHASLMAGVTMATGIYLHINQSAAWWDGKGRSFYFYDDWDDILFADKCGHFLGAYSISYFGREALVYSGFSWDQSILFGTLLGIISQTYVEFKDGYAEKTGFSVSDLGADIAGAAYFYLQHYIPFLQNFSPKWQYAPASMLGVPPQTTTQTFLDNYNCTTAWLSVHVHNLIWGTQESVWPKWLNIAFGYGVNGYYTSDIYSRFVIGIDYNLVELLPDGPPFWNWFKQTLNLIKLPAPAVEFSKYGTNFRLLYPFSISISKNQF